MIKKLEANKMNNEHIIELYHAYRKEGMDLNIDLFKILSKEDLKNSALLLNMFENDEILMDEEADMDRLAEISIHDYYDVNGKNSVQKYLESNRYEKLTDIKKIIIKAKLKSYTSFYAVDYIKKDTSIVGLIDIFNSYKKVEITDIGLTQTIKPKKTFIFTRVMKFKTFSSTSGVSYIFDKSKERKIRKEYLKIYKSLPDIKSSAKKSISFFYLNKQYGRAIKYA